VAHGIIYQMIEKRHVVWVIVFTGFILAVAVAQILGFVQVQRGLRAQTLSAAHGVTEERSPQS
jgi:uncharacterized protein YpmB